MTERSDADARLMALRQFVATCPPGLQGVRLVRASSAGVPGVRQVGLADYETPVGQALQQGLSVDWVRRNELLWLRVFAEGGPRPSWETVFAQQDMADVRAILKGDAP